MISAAVIILCALSEHVIRFALNGRITESYNPGAAFGMLGGRPGISLLLSGIACAVIMCVIYFARMKRITRLGLCVMAGGALSNMIERVYLGYVIDWIPVPFMNLQYNLADVYIALGALTVFVAVNRD